MTLLVAIARGFLSDSISSGNDGMSGEREKANMSAVVCLCLSLSTQLNSGTGRSGNGDAADVSN